MGNRKFVLAVKTWGSDEAIHSWKYLKAHILQAKDAGMWKDDVVVVHIKSKSKGKEKEPWDQGGAVIASLKTALQPYKHDVFDLEGDPGPLLVDIANKEQADILVLATRGRNAMKKAMMGSTTEFVMLRANCACLVIKPQVGAGDTYRMKSAAQPQGSGAAAALQSQLATQLQPPRANSPGSSPMYRISSLPGGTPFNRRVCIAYDTTASGRFLLKWAVDTILEPTDNLFVVRAVPNLKMRKPGTSFADKNNVQRLAKDALAGFPHVTTFNLQQGNARKSVLSFVAKESVDLLIIGMYKSNSRRKGLAVRGNAVILSNRCACPCLVVPMGETALQSCVMASDLELAAAEEEELASGSEPDSDDEEQAVGTPTAAAAVAGSSAGLVPGAGVDADDEHSAATPTAGHEPGQAGSPDTGGGLSASLRGSSAAAIKQIRAPLEALFKDFKRRGSSGIATPSAGSAAEAAGDRRAALLAALQGGTSSLHPGRYLVEVDNHGAVKSIKPSGEKHHLAAPPLAAAAAADSSPAVGVGSPEVIAVDGAVAATESAPLSSSEAYYAEGNDRATIVPTAAAVAPASGTAPVAGLEQEGQEASASQPDVVVQLQRLLAEREAEIAALRQRLQGLGTS